LGEWEIGDGGLGEWGIRDMPTFEDLNIWKEAFQLMKETYEICKGLPRDERFRQSLMIRRDER
jgi:hypothetical protein